MTDLHVAVKADNGHRNETSAAEEKAGPAVVATTLPAKQPAMGKTRHYEEWLSRDWQNIQKELDVKQAIKKNSEAKEYFCLSVSSQRAIRALQKNELQTMMLRCFLKIL